MTKSGNFLNRKRKGDVAFVGREQKIDSFARGVLVLWKTRKPEGNSGFRLNLNENINSRVLLHRMYQRYEPSRSRLK